MLKGRGIRRANQLMVKIYANRIRKGLMTIDEVPVRWREQVREYLEGEGA